MSIDPTPSANAADVSRLQTELYETRQQLAQALAAKTQTLKTEALDTALAGVKLAPGAREQLGHLLDSEIQLKGDETGAIRALGPGLVPLAQHVAAKLTQREFAKFLAIRLDADGRPRCPSDRTAGWGRRLDNGHDDPACGRGRERRSADDMARPFGLGNRPVPR